jgi:hypothetical protein
MLLKIFSLMAFLCVCSTTGAACDAALSALLSQQDAALDPVLQNRVFLALLSGVSFAGNLAGKASKYAQMPLPPAALFALKSKAQALKKWTNESGIDPAAELHKLQGIVHFDHFGQPAFVHQTLNKNPIWNNTPPAWGYMSSPMPQWLARGLFVKAVDAFYVDAVRLVPLQVSSPSISSKGDSKETGSPAAAVTAKWSSCPKATFGQFLGVQGLGVGLLDQPDLVAVCSKQLQQKLVEEDDGSTAGLEAALAANASSKQASSCIQGSAVNGNIRDLNQQQLLQRTNEPGQLQWAAILAGGDNCDLLLKAERKTMYHGEGQHKELLHWLEKFCWSQRHDARCRTYRLLGCQRHRRVHSTAATATAPNARVAVPIVAAAVVPGVLVYPNWSLLQHREAPGGCKEYRAFPALALQQPGNTSAASANGSDGVQAASVLWSALDRAQVVWFPQAVAWMNSNEAIKELVV